MVSNAYLREVKNLEKAWYDGLSHRVRDVLGDDDIILHYQTFYNGFK